jgi:hypothetical protein
MDGMQSHWWDLFDENDAIPEQGSTVSFTFNYAKISAIAEIAVAGFAPLLVTNAHAVYPCFTKCTWVDSGGNTHVEDLSTPSSSEFPVDIARNGLTSLTGEMDTTAMMARVIVNVFIWPSVTY